MAKKSFRFKFVSGTSGKSSKEVVDELVKQTINKVLSQSHKTFYNNTNENTNEKIS
ncbi:hypothetical protein [Parageobacillus galactosidasius]|jgi:hypothetical protein|uniref:hypothetical protein n=1 Tax=Parageobacillus galactosidasius TaxID=883812 RepID=UPI001469BF8C|nr:hypothetical protein [Parageobacillus galactosidasius]